MRKYGAAGNLLSQFDVAVETGGADWIDLAANGQTLFYTSEGTRLKRFNLATSQQLPDLVTNLLYAAGVRALPDGGVIVATGQNLQRFDAPGNFVRSYSIGGVYYWTSVNLDPDGISFWSVGGSPPLVARFNLETGTLLTNIPVDAIYQANSLAVMGETTAIGGGVSVRPKLTIVKDGTDVLLSWPDSATNFFLEHTLSLGGQASWQSNTIPPTVSGGQKTVRQGINSTLHYFRLRKP